MFKGFFISTVEELYGRNESGNKDSVHDIYPAGAGIRIYSCDLRTDLALFYTFGSSYLQGQDVQDPCYLTDMQVLYLCLKRHASYASAPPGLFRTLLHVQGKPRKRLQVHRYHHRVLA